MSESQLFCKLCDKKIYFNHSNNKAKKLGHKITRNVNDHDAKSECHYAHIRPKGKGRSDFKKLTAKDWLLMGIENKEGSLNMCYECHEVVLHNPVLNPSQIERLSKIFKDKTFQEKVIIFNNLIELGLKNFISNG
jgi:hypothetical protein